MSYDLYPMDGTEDGNVVEGVEGGFRRHEITVFDAAKTQCRVSVFYINKRLRVLHAFRGDTGRSDTSPNRGRVPYEGNSCSSED